MALDRGRPHDFVRYFGVKSISQTSGKRFLDATIFAGVKSQNRNTAASLENRWHISQQGIQRRELVIDRDAKCLEHTPDG